jgi:hypothetical protein
MKITAQPGSRKKLTCGGFQIKLQFELDNPTKCNAGYGYFVQLIQIWLDKMKCPCCKPPERPDLTKAEPMVKYWEAFEVINKDKTNMLANGWTDNAEYNAQPDTSGY